MKQKYLTKKKSYHIIGIDPGTSCGVCILEVDDNFELISVLPFTFYLDKSIHKDVTGDAKDALKAVALDKALSELFPVYNPIAVSTETAFSNRLFPKSGLKLAKYIGVIELSLKKYCPPIYILRSSPREIKNRFTSSGKAGKEDMTVAVMSNVELKPFFNNMKIDEHCIDATAMAYIALKDIRKDPTLLTSMRE